MKTRNNVIQKLTGLLLCSVFLIFSCSKNGPGKDGPAEEKTQLILKASLTEINVGEEVSFEITAGEKAMDADIYINDKKIEGNKYIFEQKGNYKAIAKKEGYLESTFIELTVSEAEYEVNIYVVGYERGSSGDVAKYWKNGVAQELTGRDARALSIFIDKNDVYAGGYTTNNSGRLQATIWKNNKEEIWFEGRTDYRPIITSVYVYNGDLYAAGTIVKGYLQSVAAYWKNGILQEIGEKEKQFKGESISVDENGVHLVGSCDEGRVSAFYWTNNQIYVVNDSYQGYSVFTTNGDVYMTGRSDPPAYSPQYWKNGTAHVLPGKDLAETIIATSIFVDKNDVHVGGWKMNSTHKEVAVYWKNNVLQELSDGTQNAKINNVFGFEDNVYLVGYENNGLRTVAKYWKNGVPTELTNGLANANATDIVVVKERK